MRKYLVKLKTKGFLGVFMQNTPGHDSYRLMKD